MHERIFEYNIAAERIFEYNLPHEITGATLPQNNTMVNRGEPIQQPVILFEKYNHPHDEIYG